MSNQHGEPQANIRSMFDEESISLGNPHAAEQFLAKLGMPTLVGNTLIPNLAGPRLPRCNGRGLTPQEGGPATSEREHADQRNSTP